MPKNKSSLDQIVQALFVEPGLDRATLAEKLSMKPSTLRRNVSLLIEQNVLREGLLLTDSGRPKSDRYYIEIVTKFDHPAVPDEKPHAPRNEKPNAPRINTPYQQDLRKEIRTELNKPENAEFLKLISLDIALGAAWDLMLVLYATDKKYISNFVTCFLRTHKYVLQTRTGTCIVYEDD